MKIKSLLVISVLLIGLLLITGCTQEKSTAELEAEFQELSDEELEQVMESVGDDQALAGKAVRFAAVKYKEAYVAGKVLLARKQAEPEPGAVSEAVVEYYSDDADYPSCTNIYVRNSDGSLQDHYVIYGDTGERPRRYDDSCSTDSAGRNLVVDVMYGYTVVHGCEHNQLTRDVTPCSGATGGGNYCNGGVCYPT